METDVSECQPKAQTYTGTGHGGMDEPHESNPPPQGPSVGQGGGALLQTPAVMGLGGKKEGVLFTQLLTGCGCSLKQLLLPAGRIVTGVSQVEGPRLWPEQRELCLGGHSMC